MSVSGSSEEEAQARPPSIRPARALRIVVANVFAGPVGGTESYVDELLPALRARGHAVGFLHELPAAEGQPPGFGGEPDATWCARELGAGRTAAEIARWRPDAVLVNGLLDVELERQLVRSHRAVLFAHGYYGTCASGEKRLRWPSVRACARPLGPACVALNYLRGCGARNPVGFLAYYRLQLRRRSLFRTYAAVLVASAHMRDELVRNGAPPAATFVNPLWPTGIDPSPGPPAPRVPSGRVAFVGRLTAVKGAEVAVDAVAHAARTLGRDLRLVVGGEGPERARLGRLRDNGAPVELLGRVGRPRLRALLAESDLAVLPSLWPEPFGLVGLEAASVGTPSVAFDTGGVRAWIVPAESGEVATPFESQALGAAIVRVLADPAHHQRLREGAWRQARRFTRERHVAALEELLLRICAAQGAP